MTSTAVLRYRIIGPPPRESRLLTVASKKIEREGPTARSPRFTQPGDDRGRVAACSVDAHWRDRLRNADGGKFDVDNWNDLQVQERRALDVEGVLAEAAKSRADLKVLMLALTDEDLARTLRFGGDSKRAASEIPFGAYLRGWCKHDPMHAMDMSRALPERQASLAQWFDDPVIQGYQRQMNG